MTINEMELPEFTFGWELEAIRGTRLRVPGLQVAHDGSVNGEGLEYRVRRETAFDPNKSLEVLRALSTAPGLAIDRSCGFHVHVGLSAKSRKLYAWAANVVTLARLLEKEAFEAVPESRRGNSFCRSWKQHPGSVIAPTYHPSKHSNDTRYCWLNPVEIFRPGGIRTVEFRLMGDTKSYVYLLAWVSFCRLMAFSAWACVNDPSRLQMETESLKQALTLIKTTFLHPSTGKKRAEIALLLAAKAGFTRPFQEPFKRIKETEDAINWEAAQARKNQEQYDAAIAEMRKYLELEKTSCLHLKEPLQPGDTLEVLCVDPDNGLRVGERVIVRHYPCESAVQPLSVMVPGRLNDWRIPLWCVRLVERRPVPVVAVSGGR